LASRRKLRLPFRGVRGLLSWRVSSVPFSVRYGRQAQTTTGNSEVPLPWRGHELVVAISKWRWRAVFHVSGKVEAPRAARHAPARMLVTSRRCFTRSRVPCWCGIWSGRDRRDFVLHPDIDKITICEIEL